MPHGDNSRCFIFSLGPTRMATRFMTISRNEYELIMRDFFNYTSRKWTLKHDINHGMRWGWLQDIPITVKNDTQERNFAIIKNRPRKRF